LAWLFGFTMLAAAFLLFSVQPMIAKMVLPTLGGTPGVWNTSMVFYQAALLAGYAYAHWGSRRLTATRQLAIHGLLLGLAVLFLPIVLPSELHPPSAGGVAPALWLFGLLIATAGLPMLAVAATAPLLQHWFSLSGHRDAHDPYFLYAASNAGSLAGLLCYPLVIEPGISLALQTRLWSLGFLAMVGLIAGCSVLAVWRGSHRQACSAPDQTERHGPNPGWRDRAWWAVLAFVPSSWVLGVTTYVTTDLAAIPLLWTIPLALYLLTYILAFSRRFGEWTRFASAGLFLLSMPLVLVLSAGFVHLFWMPLHLVVFFLGALACHGRLAAARPATHHLTDFYLAIAVGGVLGGAFNALLAPLIFDRLAEYPLAVVLGCLLAPAVAPYRRARSARLQWLDVILPAIVLGLTSMLVIRPHEAMNTTVGMAGITAASGVGLYACVTGLRRPVRFALSAAAVLLASGLAPSPGGMLIHQERDFFGVLRVLYDPRANVHRFMHGSTLHGQQSLDPARRGQPSTYFTRSGPIGDVFGALTSRSRSQTGSRIAIVGLGAGTLACYAQPGQSWTFFEIDPAVARIAEDSRYFSYLSDAQARGVPIDVKLGDARLKLRETQGDRYTLIVLDAFSSDAVPVHLLTREAIRLYRDRLDEGGLLAFNLTNRYLDLDPLIGEQARGAGLVCRIRYDVNISAEEKEAGKQGAIWAVMGAREADLGTMVSDPRWQLPQARRGTRTWTDDDSNLLSYMIIGGRRFPTEVTAKSPAEQASPE
jgi:hypothetical protein